MYIEIDRERGERQEKADKDKRKEKRGHAFHLKEKLSKIGSKKAPFLPVHCTRERESETEERGRREKEREVKSRGEKKGRERERRAQPTSERREERDKLVSVVFIHNSKQREKAYGLQIAVDEFRSKSCRRTQVEVLSKSSGPRAHKSRNR